jgi:hypothetical protein
MSSYEENEYPDIDELPPMFPNSSPNISAPNLQQLPSLFVASFTSSTEDETSNRNEIDSQIFSPNNELHEKMRLKRENAMQTALQNFRCSQASCVNRYQDSIPRLSRQQVNI